MSGHIYAVEFSNGVVKVGHTAWPKDRIAALRRDALPHGNPIVRTWVSGDLLSPEWCESRMIGFCLQRWMPIASEWFLGADFDKIVAFAKTLKRGDREPAPDAPPEPRMCLVETGFVIPDGPNRYRWRVLSDGLPDDWTDQGLRGTRERPWLWGTLWDYHPFTCYEEHSADEPHQGEARATLPLSRISRRIPAGYRP